MKTKKVKGYAGGGPVTFDSLSDIQKAEYSALATGAEKEAYLKNLSPNKDGYDSSGNPTGEIIDGDDSSYDVSSLIGSIGTAVSAIPIPENGEKTDAYDKNKQQAASLDSALTSTVSSINPLVGGLIGIGTKAGQGIRSGIEETDEDGVPIASEDAINAGAWAGVITDPFGQGISALSSGIGPGDNYYDVMFGEAIKKRNLKNVTAAQSDVDYVPRSGMAEGGDVKGKGTTKSDSINTELPEGSFVVPAENALIAQSLRERYLPKEEGNMQAGGGTPVRLSNGEHVFTPKERKILESRGVDLTLLAPNADESGNGYQDGTGEDGVEAPYKQPSMLEEGEYMGELVPLQSAEEIARKKAIERMSNPATNSFEAYNTYLNEGGNEAEVAAEQAKTEKQNKALLKAAEALGGTTGLLSLAQIGTGIGTAIGHKRPHYKIDADYLARVKDAVASEKYGMSAAEKEDVLSNLTLKERNLKRYASEISGGDAATAFAIAKDAQANTARSLIDLAAKDAEIMRQKKARTDALTTNKAAMGRQIFEDDLRAFDQNQLAASKLIDAGISNFVGNKQYQDAQKKMDERLALYGTTDFFNTNDLIKQANATY